MSRDGFDFSEGLIIVKQLTNGRKHFFLRKRLSENFLCLHNHFKKKNKSFQLL